MFSYGKLKQVFILNMLLILNIAMEILTGKNKLTEFVVEIFYTVQNHTSGQ